MTQREKGDKLIMVILALAVFAAAAIVIYISFDEDDSGDEDVLLSVIHGENQWKYTMNNLKNLEEYTGRGSMINGIGTINGPFEFTGVSITTLLEDVGITNLSSIKINATSANNLSKIFNADAIVGNVTIFNETGNEINWSTPVILLLAYEKDGMEISDENGPLRITYVGEGTPITLSENWVKQVISIEII